MDRYREIYDALTSGDSMVRRAQELGIELYGSDNKEVSIQAMFLCMQEQINELKDKNAQAPDT